MDRPANIRTRAELSDELATVIQWAASRLQTQLGRLAKDAGLSLPQYSVLRILSNAGESLSCSEIAERMISRDPDITRLIDKLEKTSLVSRERSSHDRRIVHSAITPRGAELVRRVNDAVTQLHATVFSSFDEPDLQDLHSRLRRLQLDL